MMTADSLLRRAEALVIKQRLQWMKTYDGEGNANLVCRRFGISRKTFYKWLKRYVASGRDAASLVDRPRTPHTSRTRTSDEVRQRIIEMREETGEGPRRIHARLREAEIRISCGTVWKIISRHEKPGAEGRP